MLIPGRKGGKEVRKGIGVGVCDKLKEHTHGKGRGGEGREGSAVLFIWQAPMEHNLNVWYENTSILYFVHKILYEILYQKHL